MSTWTLRVIAFRTPASTLNPTPSPTMLLCTGALDLTPVYHVDTLFGGAPFTGPRGSDTLNPKAHTWNPRAYPVASAPNLLIPCDQPSNLTTLRNKLFQNPTPSNPYNLQAQIFAEPYKTLKRNYKYPQLTDGPSKN